MTASRLLPVSLLLPGLVVGAAAHAQPTRAAPPTVHPLWVATEGAAFDDESRLAFKQALARYGIGPLETVDLPVPAEPPIAEALAAGIAHVLRLEWDQADLHLRRAAADAEANGGGALDGPALSDLYLHLALTIDRADWRGVAPDSGFATPTPAEPPAAPRPDAVDAYRQAALFTPDRTLYQRDFPPLVRERFEQAKAEVAARPRGALVIKGPPDALVSLDGSAPRGLPASFEALPYGDHLVRVQAPGRAPWSERLPLALARLQIEVPPLRPLSLPDEQATQKARRMSASHALVGQLRPGGQQPLIELTLLEVSSGRRLNAVRMPARGEPGALDAAVMRLDEQARRHELETREGVGEAGGPAVAFAAVEPRARPERAGDPTRDPGSWVRQRWPLLTAVGVAVATALVLGIVVAADDDAPPGAP